MIHKIVSALISAALSTTGFTGAAHDKIIYPANPEGCKIQICAYAIQDIKGNNLANGESEGAPWFTDQIHDKRHDYCIIAYDNAASSTSKKCFQYNSVQGSYAVSEEEPIVGQIPDQQPVVALPQQTDTSQLQQPQPVQTVQSLDTVTPQVEQPPPPLPTESQEIKDALQSNPVYAAHKAESSGKWEPENSEGLFWLIGLILLSLGLYFLPTTIAIRTNSPNVTAVIIVNLLFGWTVLGWILALLMAVWKSHHPHVINIHQTQHNDPPLPRWLQ